MTPTPVVLYTQCAQKERERVGWRERIHMYSVYSNVC